MDQKNEHIVIETVTPCVDGGRYPVKSFVGDLLVVEADIFRSGHELIKVAVEWKRKGEDKYQSSPMVPINNDRWQGSFSFDKNARYVYRIAAWTDVYTSWLSDFKKKVEANMDVSTEAEEGALLMEQLSKNGGVSSQKKLLKAASDLRLSSKAPWSAWSVVNESSHIELMTTLLDKSDIVHSKEFDLTVDRKKAVFGSWYEVFVRSMGTVPGKSATFKEAEARLPDIRKMGFDVLYLTPIHPIGMTSRKGPNNSLASGPNDPGCPWAIGNKYGGHTSLDPALGSWEDFDHFSGAAKSNGLELALDFAVQCSPDHPWVKEHPEWFFHRPDGSIKFAENPPMKYEDICQINFDCENWKELWQEMRNILIFWIKKGVRIFRVDNPHTKPTTFWEWLINAIQTDYPDVIFLSESLTRPKPMKALSKAGFSQSYTYFIWKNTKHELTEYLLELTSTNMHHYYRPNFFVNTPDNIHHFLQKGGKPAFKLRLALAGTLSPSYGIYSGYELCENEAHPGTEEYLNSEKFEISRRDWNKPGNIKDFVAKINSIRNENPALHSLPNLVFFEIDNHQMISYGKATRDLSNIVFVVANLDPHQSQSGNVRIPLDKFGIPWGSQFQVKDLMTGARFYWGERNFVELHPQHEPIHILRVER